MSTLSVNIPSATSYVTQPQESVTLEGEIKINRIVDIPGEKKVIAFVDTIGRIELAELSGDNYDTPAEWTNADVVTAVQNIING
tara:strand:+ start:707 stop:958 length:252 start_codon:yes stop_codon:yes gene_type:complete